jgi:hypothetical protein
MAKNASPEAYKVAGHVAWRRVVGEAVILDLDSSDYYALNDVGALIWEKLEKGESSDRIQEAVCAEFDVAPELALKDIKALIKALAGKKLLLPA